MVSMNLTSRATQTQAAQDYMLPTPARQTQSFTPSVVACGPHVPLEMKIDHLSPGAAVRLCDEDQGWLEPDLFNCTSPAFRELSLLVRLPRPCPALKTCPGPGLSLPRPVVGSRHHALALDLLGFSWLPFTLAKPFFLWGFWERPKGPQSNHPIFVLAAGWPRAE